MLWPKKDAGPCQGKTVQARGENRPRSPGSLRPGRRFRTRLSASAGTRFPSRPRVALRHPASSRCAARRATEPVTASPASPALLPHPLPPCSFPDSREFQSRLPAPLPRPRSRALSRPRPGPSRATATANEVRGRVRRFKRRLLSEARREIRRCGQNPAGVCEPCRAARSGERAGVGARS